jgi:5-formyltetrahydrofolate cyclo-ligase
MKQVGQNAACILVPGRKFDMSGSRIGRGGGWYDKFLSRVPRTWTRIGIAYNEDICNSPIPQNEWDQKMDYLVAFDHTGKFRVINY